MLAVFTQAQIKQNIRGVLVDKQSQTPVAGASVVIESDGIQNAMITDDQGYFKFEKINVGTYSIFATLLGFQSVTIQNIELLSGKELVLKIELEEKVMTTQEIVVRADLKDKPLNEMATVSARALSMEETNRFAGTWMDPARMAANFAGVMAAGDQRNDIIIRGNSPMGLLWKLEGVCIPNPNHFGTLGTTGGPISILNNNLLDNSDFFTGAFPAEYGNALSGVFDLKIREGNNEKHEYTTQIGLNGFEADMEGPISKKKKSSYLLSYRFSTLKIFELLGIHFGVSAIPQYQDASFKFNFPATKLGKFSLFGIGGTSFIDLADSKRKEADWSFGHESIDIRFGSDMGVSGIKNVYFIDKDTRLESVIAISGTRSTAKVDSAFKNRPPVTWFKDNSTEVTYSLVSQFKKKFNAKRNLSAGFSLHFYDVNYRDSVMDSSGVLNGWTNTKGRLIANFQSFVQHQYKFSDHLIIYAGLHYQFFTLNSENIIEPRTSLRWTFLNKHSLSLASGLHSQLQARLFYFYQTMLPDGSQIETNTGLKSSRSWQSVLAYDFMITPQVRLKLETYYQHLYKIPVDTKEDYYSIINYGTDFYGDRVDSLVNKGKARNYGIELTLEHFLHRNFYALFTISLFESKYTASDGIERNTIFNGNYVVNLLSGYRLKVGKNSSLNFDFKTVYAGGKRYIPIDQALSELLGEEILIFEQAYKERMPDYFRLDIRAGYKINLKKLNIEMGFDIQNITQHKNVFMMSYDTKAKEIRYDYQLGLFYIALLRIQF